MASFFNFHHKPLFEYDPTSEKEILSIAKKLQGKSLSDLFNDPMINEINGLKGNKGGLGQIIEGYYFGHKPNSIKDSDFPCNLELKVTPCYLTKKNELRPKERLVCNIINFNEIIKERWESSTFLKKNNHILLIRYIDPKDKMVQKSDYKIIDVRVHVIIDSKYYEQFKLDWTMIVEKIKEGRAHELSESDTCVLGACTKGKNKESLRSQPNSKELAMQRAFSLKSQYMKILLKLDNLI
jgi:DNA mismatch repair protein MutH